MVGNKEVAMVKKCVVRLTKDEREKCQQIITRKSRLEDALGLTIHNHIKTAVGDFWRNPLR